MPQFRPGRHLPGLLLAGTIFDMAFGTLQHWKAGGNAGMYAIRDYDMSGWTHLCGPVGAPPNYSYPILNRWTVALAAGWNGGAGPGVCGLAEQSIAGQLSAPNAGVRARYRWWSKITGAGAGSRYAVAEEWGRNPAGTLPIALVTPIARLAAVNIPGVLLPAPPLVPVIVRPVPLLLVSSVTITDLPEGNYRGYFPPAVAGPIAANPRPTDPFVRVVPGLVDAVPNPWTPEAKTPANSPAGQALTSAFRLLSMYGTSQAFINALWQALPSWARTPHARNADKLRDLAANLGAIDLDQAFANSLLAGVRTALAGAMYGAATNALAATFGEAGGFGLYRAWATGEFGYSASGQFNPLRPSRGGGNLGWESDDAIAGSMGMSFEEFSRRRRQAYNNRSNVRVRDNIAAARRAARDRFRNYVDSLTPDARARYRRYRKKRRDTLRRAAGSGNRRAAWMISRGRL